MSSSELHAKVLGFLATEFSKKQHHSCVRVELLYSQSGFRDDELRSWERTADPELFENMVRVEQLASTIIEIAEGHADSFGTGRHRYVIRTKQHMGGRAMESFSLRPSFEAGSDPNAMTIAGQGDRGSATGEVLGILTQNNLAFMRTHQQMYQTSFGTLASLTENLRSENVELRTENTQLRREVEELRSNKDEREFQIALTAKRSERSDKMTEKILQIGSVVAAKIMGPNKELGSGTDALSMLLIDFGKSLHPQQVLAFQKILEPTQLLMFFEIMEMVAPKNGAPTGQGANGAHTSAAPSP